MNPWPRVRGWYFDRYEPWYKKWGAALVGLMVFTVILTLGASFINWKATEAAKTKQLDDNTSVTACLRSVNTLLLGGLAPVREAAAIRDDAYVMQLGAASDRDRAFGRVIRLVVHASSNPPKDEAAYRERALRVFKRLNETGERLNLANAALLRAQGNYANVRAANPLPKTTCPE